MLNLARDFVAELVVVRTPLLPFEEIETWSAGLLAPSARGDADALRDAIAHDRALLRERLASLLERPEVREALFVASPDLVESLSYWQCDPDGKKGQRAEHGFVRYLLRMATRPTPFGLFSGCTAGSLGDRTRLALSPRGDYRRHSRLDMDYLFALCEDLGRNRELRAGLTFRPNPSAFEAGGRLRYAEARIEGRRRTYHLVAVGAFDALRDTLGRAAAGATLDELASALVVDDPDPEEQITLEDARAFVHDLIDNQLLLPDLALPLTGEESTPGLLRQLAGVASAREAAERVSATERALAEIDALGLGSTPGRYREIARHLEPLGISAELSRLFQIDLFKPAREVVLGEAVTAEILRGVELLYRVAGERRQEPVLDAFRKAFRDRYGDGREVALSEVLDEESGIGFDRSATAAAEASPLLAGLPFRLRGERPSAPWTPADAVLLRLLSTSQAAGSIEVELTEESVKALENRALPPMPDAFHAMAILAAASQDAVDRGDFRVLLHNGTGPSGARMLGRFCHADETIRSGVEAHLAAEEALAPDALFAEIVHLPAGRVGNVLARPVLRRYEIPFLGRSGAPSDRQIPVDDLFVSVLGDRIRLRSKSRDREVIPRLTTAHNTTGESLGVYRFLSALQQAVAMEWNWGPLETAPFLPRVVSGRAVLSRARWRFGAAETKPLVAATGAKRYALAQQWREQHRMPRYVALMERDHELLLDFQNPLIVDAVVELFRNADEVLLVEVYPSPDELCADGPEGRFFHELVIPFVHRVAEPDAARPHPAAGEGIRPHPAVRTFPPGSEWLFAKLYMSAGTADQVLREELAPLAAEVLAAGAADRWFFIRFGDPDWHLRARFHGRPDELRGFVLPRLEQLFARLLEAGMAWKFQVDTYEREIERYGGDEAIELSEEIFFRDSEAVVEMLHACTTDAGADLRWQMMLVGMDRLLGDFGLDLQARLNLVELARGGFAKHYNYEALREPLADRFRRDRPVLQGLLDLPVPALDVRSAANAEIARELRARERRGRLQTPVATILPSYIHMFVNRLSRSAGPEHELVLYDYLAQLYRSRLARSRSSSRRVFESSSLEAEPAKL